MHWASTRSSAIWSLSGSPSSRAPCSHSGSPNLLRRKGKTMKASSLLLSLSILFGSGITLASDLAVGSDAQVSKLVEAALLKPLANREEARSRYSRVRMPPAARHVRVLEGGPEMDPQGRTFVRFAVDEKRFAEWDRNAMV